MKQWQQKVFGIVFLLQPFHFHRQYKEQHHLKIRIQQGKRQKQRKIQISVAHIARNQAGKNRSNCSEKIKDVEPKTSPFPFQTRPNQPIEIHGKENPNRTRIDGNKEKRQNSPNFPVKNCTAAKIKVAGKRCSILDTKKISDRNTTAIPTKIKFIRLVMENFLNFRSNLSNQVDCIIMLLSISPKTMPPIFRL